MIGQLAIWLGVATGVFLLSLLLTGWLRRYALHRGLLDTPNARSSHIQVTPRGGGLGFVLVYLGLMLLVGVYPLPGLDPLPPLFWAVLPGAGLVALIGFIDDHRDLSAKLRILVHLLAASWAVWVLEIPPVQILDGSVTEGWWLYLLGVLALVWLLNLYNFMDGIDGIASLEAICVLLGASLILLINQGDPNQVAWLLFLAAAVTGFLVWNWPPAKIFMGDVASGFLGFSLGVFALYTAWGEAISIWSWIILLGLFVVDASWTLLMRMSRGEAWYKPHAQHAYQIQARQVQAMFRAQGVESNQSRALAHRRVVMRGVLINLLWLTPLAWCASHWPGMGFGFTMLGLAPLVLDVWRSGAGREDRA
ncbi:MAG: glycosyltransferase family 4 protein [Candidatus Thiodiazotropha sp.]